MTSPITLGPGEGTTIEGPAGGPLTFKVRGEHTGGSLTAFENVIARSSSCLAARRTAS